MPFSFTWPRVGSRWPLYCTGMGRALLAFQEPAFVDRYLASARTVERTELTVTGVARLRRIIAGVRVFYGPKDNLQAIDTELISRARETIDLAAFVIKIRINIGHRLTIGVQKTFEQQLRHRQGEHGITQELQALVVVCPPAAVRERALQQRHAREAVTEAFLKCVEAAVHRSYFDRPSYLMSR